VPARADALFARLERDAGCPVRRIARVLLWVVLLSILRHGELIHFLELEPGRKQEVDVVAHWAKEVVHGDAPPTRHLDPLTTPVFGAIFDLSNRVRDDEHQHAIVRHMLINVLERAHKTMVVNVHQHHVSGHERERTSWQIHTTDVLAREVDPRMLPSGQLQHAVAVIDAENTSRRYAVLEQELDDAAVTAASIQGAGLAAAELLEVPFVELPLEMPPAKGTRGKVSKRRRLLVVRTQHLSVFHVVLPFRNSIRGTRISRPRWHESNHACMLVSKVAQFFLVTVGIKLVRCPRNILLKWFEGNHPH
jgi:hypothetical protein